MSNKNESEAARVGMCAVGVPDPNERAVLREAFDLVTSTLRATEPRP